MKKDKDKPHFWRDVKDGDFYAWTCLGIGIIGAVVAAGLVGFGAFLHWLWNYIMA